MFGMSISRLLLAGATVALLAVGGCSGYPGSPGGWNGPGGNSHEPWRDGWHHSGGHGGGGGDSGTAGQGGGGHGHR